MVRPRGSGQTSGALAWLHKRLEWVGFYCRDAFEVIPSIEEADGTAIYADPTFISKDHLYQYYLNSKPNGADLPSDDHNRLAEILNRFDKTRVVLGYYRHDRLSSL